MSDTPYANELQVAIEAARCAGEYLRDNQHHVAIQQIKSSAKDYATAQDLGSERLILDAIRTRFPDDSVLSEESHPEECDAERLWIVDPLDGTRNYANGLDHFAVSIAFSRARDVKVGVVYLPCAGDELFHAEKDHGAFLNGRVLQMATPAKSLEASLVATGFSYHQGRQLHPHIAIFEKVMNAATDVLRFGSAAADMCYVAAGRFGAYYESSLKPWDAAAAARIVAEAGGIVTDTTGRPLDLLARNGTAFSLNVLAAKNPAIGQELTRLLTSA